MTKVKTITGAKGFDYSEAPQRSPEWIALRPGRIGASELGRWMAVGKRDGKPLKARLDLEKEIAFEKAFGVPFTKFTTQAMQDGIDNEDMVRDQYSSQLGVSVKQVGAFYNDYFVASPDGLVGDDGGIEIKWPQDTNWAEVALSRQPLPEHLLQIQGNLYASGRKWWDYVVANGNTGRFVVIRVKRDEKLIAEIAESVKAVADIAPMDTDNMFTLTTKEEAIWT